MENNFSQIVDAIGLKKVTKGALIAFVGWIAIKASMYVYLIIRARVLGPYWLGIYSLGVLVILFVIIFPVMGFDVALSKYVAIYQSEQDRNRVKGLLLFVFSVSIMLSMILTIALFMFSNQIATLIFHDANLARPVRLFSFSIPFATFCLLLAGGFRGLKDMKDMQLMKFLHPVLALLFFLALMNFFESKIWPAVYAYIIAHAVVSGIGWRRLIKKLPFLAERGVKYLVNKKEMFSYSLSVFLVSALFFAFNKLDMFMIGFFCTSEKIGLYAPAFHFASIISLPLVVFNQIFSPTIAEYYHNGKMKELKYLFKTVARWVFMISFPVFLFIILFNKEIMLLLGERYLAAYGVLIILGFAQLISASVGSVGSILMMTAYQKILFWITSFTLLLNIALNIILIPRMGMIGASIATGISVILWNILGLIFVFKTVKIQPYNIKFYKPLLSGLIACGMTYIFSIFFNFPNYILRLVFLGLFFFVLYLFLGLLLKYEKEERFIFNVIKSKLLRT